MFGNQGRHVFDHVEEQLSHMIMSYWSNFAKSNDPNHISLPQWPRFFTSNDENIFLETPPRTGTGLLRSACDFWDVHFQKYYNG